MPFKSKAQERYFGFLKGKGKLPKSIDLKEWHEETEGKKLPEYVGRKTKKSKKELEKAKRKHARELKKESSPFISGVLAGFMGKEAFLPPPAVTIPEEQTVLTTPVIQNEIEPAQSPPPIPNAAIEKIKQGLSGVMMGQQAPANTLMDKIRQAMSG